MITAEQLEKGEICPKNLSNAQLIRIAVYGVLMTILTIAILAFYFNMRVSEVLTLKFLFSYSPQIASLSTVDYSYLLNSRVTMENLSEFLVKSAPAVISDFSPSNFMVKSDIFTRKTGQRSEEDLFLEFKEETEIVLINPLQVDYLYPTRVFYSEVDFFHPSSDFPLFSKAKKLNLSFSASIYVPAGWWFQVSSQPSAIFASKPDRFFLDLYNTII